MRTALRADEPDREDAAVSLTVHRSSRTLCSYSPSPKSITRAAGLAKRCSLSCATRSLDARVRRALRTQALRLGWGRRKRCCLARFAPLCARRLLAGLGPALVSVLLRPAAGDGRTLSIEIQCIGAARTVTGSRHLLRTKHSTILLDCGMFQGHRRESLTRNRELGFSASDVDAVVLSHAHIDHSGALPTLCKQGFQRDIYATPATRDLCAVMLVDAAMIQASDARYLNRAIERDNVDAEPIEPLFDQDDVELALSRMIALPYHRRRQIAPDVWLTFLEAGHVLGSALCVLEVDD